MSGTVSALFYLWSRSLVNVLLARARRLKQPKYLLGAVLGIGYIYLLFVYPSAARDAAETQAIAPPAPDRLITIAAIGLLAGFVLAWIWWRKRTVLQFSDAEIAYLFPGPITQAALVHYHLVRGHAGLLLSALLFTLISLNWTFIESPLAIRFTGWWLLLSVVSLYMSASGFVLTRLLNRGLAQWQRQLLMLAVLALGVWLLNVVDPRVRLPTVFETSPPAAFGAYLQDQVGGGALYWMLLPFRALLAPLLAPDLASFLRASIPALALVAVHYAWAFKCATLDHEASLDAAAKRANLIAALRKGNIRAPQTRARADPFRLAAHGTPVVAFLWKNLLATRQYFRLSTLLGAAAVLLVWDWWMQVPPRYVAAAIIPTLVALVTAVQVLMFGPQVARHDLRSDMENADLMKTWPLEGWQIVLGQLLAPTAILTGILWLCLLQAGLSLESPRVAWWTPQLRLTVGVALGLLLPFLVAVQLLVANAVVVLFGGWVKLKGPQPQGIEVGIQRLFFFAGQWLVMLLASLPGLLFAVVAYIPFSWLIDVYAVLPAAIVAALVLAGELAWGINWLGERFDKYDLSA